MTKAKPKQEFDGHGRHRLVADDGRKTIWAPYQGIAYLDGWVGCSAYYLTKEAVVTPDKFCEETAATELAP